MNSDKGNAPAEIYRETFSSSSRNQAAATTEWIARVGQESFLLDWLAGGEACRRNIQGFSFHSETLNVVIAFGK